VKVVPNAMKRTHVVILGGGFGGVFEDFPGRGSRPLAKTDKL